MDVFLKRRPSTNARQCGFESAPKVLMVLVPAMASLFLSTCALGARYQPSSPLAMRVYRIFHLPTGAHPWLPALAKIVQAIPRTNRWTPEKLSAARLMFKRRLADANAVVRALNDGTDPIALHNKLLGAISISLGYAPPDGKRWLYGSLLQRMEVAYLFTRQGIFFCLHGHSARGKRWLRAALLLECQDDLQRPWNAILGAWVRVPLAQGSASWSAGARKSHAAFLALFANRRQQRRLDDLYRLALRRSGGAFARNYNSVAGARAAEMAKLSPAATDAIIHNLRESLAEAPTPFWTLGTIRAAFSLRQRLNLAGDSSASGKMKAVLDDWGTMIKADNSIPRLDRAALLRWIKEASLP